nr:TRAP transporter small permease [uncultured Agathobacter sp.]
MKKILHYLDEYLEEFLMVVFLIAMTLIMGIQVFSRYILGMSLSWSEEITRYLFIWSAFLSVSLCTRKCISIKIDQFIQLFPKRGKSLWKVLNLTVEFVFFVYLIPYSFIYLKNTIESGQVSPACGIPMYYVQAAPFVCFIITAFRIAQRWFGEWKIVLGKDNKPLEEGNIATVIEEAVVEDEFREKELMETLKKKLEDERKEK